MLNLIAGDYLISHTVTRAVPSAQRGLTSVFEMGTGDPSQYGHRQTWMALGGWLPAASRGISSCSGWFLPEAVEERECNLAPKLVCLKTFATKLIGITRLVRRAPCCTARS